MYMSFVVQVALSFFLIEFGQYWMHRLMHNSFLWWTHAPHHHITQLNAMILCDRMFGTHHAGETAVVGQDERRRLSIAHQFMFPLRPLLASIKPDPGKSS